MQYNIKKNFLVFLECPAPPVYANGEASPFAGPYTQGTVVTYNLNCVGVGGPQGTCPVQCWTPGSGGSGLLVIICELISQGQLQWIQQQPNAGQPPPPSSPIIPLGSPYCIPGSSGTCEYKYKKILCKSCK